jgi:phenylacetate-CoA ligase
MYQRIYSKAIYPVYRWLQRDGALAATKELDMHDSLSPGEMRKVEQEKLVVLLDNARQNVPYYRDLLSNYVTSDTGEIDASVIRSLPLLSKAIIREQGKNLISTRLGENRIDANSTSGSTGSPLHFYTDRRSKAYRKACVTRNRKWLGVMLGEPVVHLWGSPIDQRRADALRGKIHSILTRETILSAYAMSDDQMSKYALTIQRLRAPLLVGYPSALVQFGRFCVKHQLRFPEIRAIVCSAETMYPHQREEIQAAFETPVFNRYGCREVGDIAHEVPGGDGLVVNSDRILVEILDPEGNPCPAGVQGEIVVTDLDNFGMPFIRYQIGDRGAWTQEGSAQGRLPFPVLESVDGRSLDVVAAPNGNRIGGTFWTILFRKRPGILDFQVEQTALDHVLIRYVKDQGVANPDQQYFRDMIADACGPDMHVKFTEVDQIVPEKNGKYRVVISSCA